MKHFIIAVLFLLVFFNSYSQKVKISTSLGDIIVKLEPEKAPITVSNFLKYIESGFYIESSFFRTVRSDNQPKSPIKITVIQGGAAEGKDRFDSIPLERSNKTGIKHKNGTISMARGEPNTAQDSFFICIEDQPELDFGGKRNPDRQGFAAFGEVISGMDVVRKINESPCEGQSLVPPILILDVVVIA